VQRSELQYIPTEDQDADILTKALIRISYRLKDNPFLEREC
jgi:hypothetical protein